MEAEQVIKKILADAEGQAQKINKQAQDKLAAEKAKQDAELADYKKESLAIARKRAEDEKSHMLAAARMEAAKEYLQEKNNILDQVFEKALEKIEKLPDDDYLQLMKKLMLEAVETGNEEVIVDPKEKLINKAFIDNINGRLGSKGSLQLSATKQDIGRGFILKRGKIKTNVSVKVLLEQVRKELEIDLAKDIFADVS
jgi:V/A-type H+-transporting ATPase subunit E